MNGFEFIKTLNIEQIKALFHCFKMYKCRQCFYHFEKEDCYLKDCNKGLELWLESELPKEWEQSWQEIQAIYNHYQDLIKRERK